MEKTTNKKEDIVKNFKRAMPSNSPLDLGGKLPPQALDLEEAVLGAMMLERGAINEVMDILKPESFYKESHQRIFAAMMTLFADSSPVDILTVTDKLRKNGDLEMAGGAYYISQLTNRIASGANIEYYARIIIQKHVTRELIKIADDTLRKAYDETTDALELLDATENNLFKIAEGNIKKNYDSMSVLMQKAIKEIEAARNNKEGISGVPTGFTALDRVTSGWQKSDMIVVAARPAMGKTAFVLSMARNVAVKFKRPVAFFSLEMSSVQLVNRLIASEAEIDASKLRKGNLADHEFQQMHSRIRNLAEAPIFIDDTPALSVFELRAKARRLKQQHDIELIIIDYLQLMSGGDSKGNREQEISTISRSIKTIAKELNIPIIALSQLSRSVETRGGDKRPQLSDLRESGAIEQDADIVAFIYRPEYYGFNDDADGRSLRGVGEIMIAKHRNGSLENVQLKFVGQFAKFDNIDEYQDFGGGTGSALGPNDAFDGGSSTMIRSSKMNNDDPLGGDDDTGDPF